MSDISQRESAARACKAYKLILALEAYGRGLGIDVDTVAGTNRLCEHVTCFADRQWELLARAARVNDPSADTRTQVMLMLKSKASFLFDAPVPKSLTYSQRPGPTEVVNG